MRYLFIIILACVIFSCETNWGKYGGFKIEFESAIEYYIVLDKIDTVLENYPYYNKGAFIKYYRNDSAIDTVFIGGDGMGMVIPSYVDATKTSFDSKFILIAQKPLDSICECNDSCLKNTYPNWKVLPTYKMCKEALEKSTYYQYWIINKTNNAVFGPYNKKVYLKKLGELGVPKELNLIE